MLDHPLVQHFWEEQGGQEQVLIMRVLSRHIDALDRQVQESVMIEKMAEVSKECLNLKSEWAGSKIPGLRVSNPKGLVSNKEGGEEENLDLEEGIQQFREAVRRGKKRIPYRSVGVGESESGNESEVVLSESSQVIDTEREEPAMNFFFLTDLYFIYFLYKIIHFYTNF